MNITQYACFTTWKVDKHNSQITSLTSFAITQIDIHLLVYARIWLGANHTCTRVKNGNAVFVINNISLSLIVGELNAYI